MIKSVYAITCSQNTNSLREAKFYSSLEHAKTKLNKLASDRKHSLGVRCFEKKELEFHFLFGWEESLVKFSIVEIKLDIDL